MIFTVTPKAGGEKKGEQRRGAREAARESDGAASRQALQIPNESALSL